MPAGRLEEERSDDDRSRPGGDEGFLQPAGRWHNRLRKVMLTLHSEKPRQDEWADSEDRQQDESLRREQPLQQTREVKRPERHTDDARQDAGRKENAKRLATQIAKGDSPPGIASRHG